MENEGPQLAERGYGRRHLSHRGAINSVAVKVQEDDVGAGLQHAHQLHQLIAPQLPEALCLSVILKFSVTAILKFSETNIPAESVLSQVYFKLMRVDIEVKSGVEHQLQVLREGHGRRREVALPKGVTVGWRLQAARERFWSEMHSPSAVAP